MSQGLCERRHPLATRSSPLGQEAVFILHRDVCYRYFQTEGKRPELTAGEARGWGWQGPPPAA